MVLLVEWTAGCLATLLVGWPVGRLVGWLVDYLVGYLVCSCSFSCLFLEGCWWYCRLDGWLVGLLALLVGRPVGWLLIGWFGGFAPVVVLVCVCGS